DTWENVEEAAAATHAAYGSLLPSPDVVWKDPASDVALGRWARQGFGAHRLEAATEEIGAREGERFAVCLEKLNRFEVRPGLARYGGDLFLDRSGHPTRIVYGGESIIPSDSRWEFAKFAFRSTSLVWTTLADHVLRCHYSVANALYLSTHRFLPLSHPL